MRKRKGSKAHVESLSRRVVPCRLLSILEEHIPGFKEDKYAFEIAWMLWLLTDPTREHSHHQDSISMGTDEIRHLFGEVKHFKNTNRNPLSRYFFVLRHLNNTLSPKDSFTIGYRPVPWMQKALDWVIASGGTGDLVDKSRRSRRTTSRAIRSTDTRGHALSRWRGVAVPSLIPINTENLTCLLRKWELILSLKGDERLFNALLSINNLREAGIVRAHRQTQLFIAESKNSRHPGKLFIHYVLHDSGRLYAEGLNLQSCKREIRQAALAGNWDVDISTCHFSIMAQMALRFGQSCSGLQAYVSNKKAFRDQIAKDIDIFPSEAKKVINAVGYGAMQSTSHHNAIPAIIGLERAKALFRHPYYIAIKADVDAATKVILSNQGIRNGSISNLANRAIRLTTHEGKPVKSNSLMAHLLQGVEAAALESAVRVCAGRVLLLQHDGFTATEQIDPEVLRLAVLESTGYDLNFDVEQIQMPLADLSVNVDFNKNFKPASKPNVHAGFGAFWPIKSGTIAFSPSDVPPVYPLPLPESDLPF